MIYLTAGLVMGTTQSSCAHRRSKCPENSLLSIPCGTPCATLTRVMPSCIDSVVVYLPFCEPFYPALKWRASSSIFYLLFFSLSFIPSQYYALQRPCSNFISIFMFGKRLPVYQTDILYRFILPSRHGPCRTSRRGKRCRYGRY